MVISVRQVMVPLRSALLDLARVFVALAYSKENGALGRNFSLILLYNVVNVVSLLFDHYAIERILLYMVLLDVTHPFYGKMLWWLVKMVLGLRSVAQKFLNC